MFSCIIKYVYLVLESGTETAVANFVISETEKRNLNFNVNSF